MIGRLDRRHFLGIAGMGAAVFALPSVRRAASTQKPPGEAPALPDAWFEPPREFSQAPFWFRNDDLSETEIVRQLKDFQAHGHPQARQCLSGLRFHRAFARAVVRR